MQLATEYPVEVESEDRLVQVEMDWIGEGNSGDYDSEDPHDVPLVRFSLYRKFEDDVDAEKFGSVCDTDAYQDGEWAAVNDGSYCTQIDARLPREKIEEYAKEILAHVESGIRSLMREKRLYEKLSWIGGEE